jgi:2-isopropylmalate synthase
MILKSKKERIYLYDSTLRDGAQTSTVSFNSKDKQDISIMLDNLGIDYIEGGWPGANPTDDEFFNNLPKLKKSKFTAFGMTNRASNSAQNDPGLNALINSNATSVCIFGKSWKFHLEHSLNISKEDNYRIIGDSIKHIANTKEAMFDAEHFFDGYKDDSEFALECIKTAYKNGARWIILCDTNGGTLPSEILSITKEVIKHIPGENLGIHCHNDTGNAVANSIAAVEAGVRQIQGTINGLGERCGNANLISLIPTLMLKMNYDVGINDGQLRNLVKVSNFLDNLITKDPNRFAPYVGEFAFAHKGGVHVSAIAKNPRSYEHIAPEIIGNKRKIMVSNQSGRSNIIDRLKSIGLNEGDHIKYSQISELLTQVKELESQGYAYDEADASFEILAKRKLSMIPNFFELLNFKVLNERRFDANGKLINVSEATIKVKINDQEILTVSGGNGPVNALDSALRKALLKDYPQLGNIRLTDYKVRILTPSKATQATTRVQIESQDEKGNKWITIGVSENILDASYNALKDSITYKLMQN